MNSNDLISALANNDPALGADVPPRMLWALLAGAVSSMSLVQVTKAALPWLSVLLVFLVLITYIPAISLALPNLMGM